MLMTKHLFHIFLVDNFNVTYLKGINFAGN